MRDSLKRCGRRLGVGWLWPVVLLALPDCSFHPGIPASVPTTTAVFCDIEGPLFGRHCASDDERTRGIRQEAAAVALNIGATTDVGLDESLTSLTACSGTTGGPEAVINFGAFPEGQPACVSPASLGTGLTYEDPNAFCVAVCKGYFGGSSDPTVVAFCGAHAHASTNVPTNPSPGFADGCTSQGTLRDDFVDPRRTPEPVVWQDPLGVTPSGNNLMRTAPTSPPLSNPPFDAGAASTQWIGHGDAYVEFSAAENTASHVLGLSELGSCPFPCTDTDASLTDITFAISLNKDGRFYVIEGGSLVTGPDLNGSFGTYNAGERFRVSLRQSSDGSSTATVTYSRLTGSCIPGKPCPETAFFTHTGFASYPLRVDTSFREVNASVTDVRLVRIQ